MVRLRRNSVPRNLKDITWEEFAKSKISDIDTWPYLPSGLLKQKGAEGFQPSTDELIRMTNEDWNESRRFTNDFSEKQKLVLGWIITASIGVLGNLAVNFAFGFPRVGYNIFWMELALFFVAILVVIYLLFLPRVSLNIRFFPSYESFPSGYETAIQNAPCHKPYSQTVFSYNRLAQMVADFGSAVRLAILRECLMSALEKKSYIHISNIWKVDEYLPVCYIEVSTKGIRPWLDRHGKRRIETELRKVVDQMMNARQLCSVRKFELDKGIWNIRGCDFIDGVSAWDFKEVRDAIVNLVKSDQQSVHAA
jgi:hypothetical protein